MRFHLALGPWANGQSTCPWLHGSMISGAHICTRLKSTAHHLCFVALEVSKPVWKSCTFDSESLVAHEHKRFQRFRDRIQLPRLLRYPLPPDCLADEPEEKWLWQQIRSRIEVGFGKRFVLCQRVEDIQHVHSLFVAQLAQAAGDAAQGLSGPFRFYDFSWNVLDMIYWTWSLWTKCVQFQNASRNGCCSNQECYSVALQISLPFQDFVMDLNRGMHMTQISINLSCTIWKDCFVVN